MEGIFIPMELLEINELTNTECMVLAIYRYYTVNGSLHCCTLKNEDICKMVRLKDESNLRRIKKHLKELGYIRTDGGIRVIYLGTKGGLLSPPKEDIDVPQGGHISPEGRTYKSKREDIDVPHKEEERKEKRIKKEGKKGMTNLDLILDGLPQEYLTSDRIDYIKNNFIEKINKADFNEGGILDTFIKGIKVELSKRYPIEFNIEKEVPVCNTIDVI